MKSKGQNNRRDFLKNCGLLTAPFLIPTAGIAAGTFSTSEKEKAASSTPTVNFIWEGLYFSPEQYIHKLAEINAANPIKDDYYGQGGPTTMLEEEFAKVTGKEKAIYLPTGTMANQLAMKLLNGEKTKVIVPENSHIFRDEGDAAQSVHALRLIPVGKDKPYYDLDDLKSAIEYSNKNFHYDSLLGTVVIENPVRRVSNRYVPIENIKEISAYCREQGYKLHLDGARLHIAAAFSGVSVKEYASYFDTVYISLYKYLNATGGAILCGDSETIHKVVHQIKILGGSILRNWEATAMALNYLANIDEKWQEVIQKGNQIIPDLNKIKGIEITSLENGTNSYNMVIDKEIDTTVLSNVLHDEFNMIWLPRVSDDGDYTFAVNASMLLFENDEILRAWKTSIKEARK